MSGWILADLGPICPDFEVGSKNFGDLFGRMK
jgi:hypothetical protein